MSKFRERYLDLCKNKDTVLVSVCNGLGLRGSSYDSGQESNNNYSRT